MMNLNTAVKILCENLFVKLYLDLFEGIFFLDNFTIFTNTKDKSNNTSNMNLEEAKLVLRAHGKPTCPCKYNNNMSSMIEEAIKLSNKQSHSK